MEKGLSSFSRAAKRGVKVTVCRASFFVRGEIKHKQRMRGGPSLKEAEHIAQ